MPESDIARPSLIERLGDPRSWRSADKVLVIACGTVPFPILFAILAHVQYDDPGLPEYLNRDFLPLVRLQSIIVSIAWAITIAIALVMRSRPGEHGWLVQLTFFQWCAGTLFMVYCFGAATSPVILQLLGGAFIGALLFDVAAIRPVAIVTSLALVAMLTAERLRWIPYAPLLDGAPYEDGIPAAFWYGLTLILMSAIGFAVFGIGAVALVRWRQREAEVTELNALMKRIFGRYLSREVMDLLLREPGAVELGGRRREVTILVSDIRGFTPLSERHTPEQVVNLLNRYVGTMSELGELHLGTVTDIVGDGLLFVFGAPLELTDHAGSAVACAIEMQNAMPRLNAMNAADGLPEIEIGIGLHTAEVIVGNVGSERRSKFGVVGSGVNLASRIEGYTVGGQILVSQSVADRLGDSLQIDLSKRVRPRGSEQTIEIHQIGGLGGPYGLMLEARDREPEIASRPRNA